ncbi:MAG: hypothetical protein M1823_003408 [Watsoniomyces obsoletus]|nr:MAG: hypothetical protein M1823_003408 [Watsoniomyces obsoletus]
MGRQGEEYTDFPNSNNPFTASASSTNPSGQPHYHHLFLSRIANPETDVGPDFTVREPPPLYSVSVGSAAASSTETDDRFHFLYTFDIIFLIDDSASMWGKSWQETNSALCNIAPVCTYHDKDGIDIHFLNHGVKQPDLYTHIKSVEMVQDIFNKVQPSGGTPTGVRLHQLLQSYLARYKKEPKKTKPLNIIVITDGVASDDVESVIIKAAEKLDKLDAPAWQVGIQFIQVGNEKGAAEALKQLDDGLAEVKGIRDMVDTVPFDGGVLTGDQVLKVVLGAVNRRIDRKNV